MEKKEEKEIYEIDNYKYIVTARTVENAKSLSNLYEAFSKYALKRLNATIWKYGLTLKRLYVIIVSVNT